MGGRTRIRADRSQANKGLPYILLRFRPFHDAYVSGDSDVRRPIFTSNCRKIKKKNHNQEKDDNASILNDSRQSLHLWGLTVVVCVCFCCCYCCGVVLGEGGGEGGVWHRHPFQSSSLWWKHCTGRTLFVWFSDCDLGSGGSSVVRAPDS